MSALEDRLCGSLADAVAFVEWMADGGKTGCTGNGSGTVCRYNAPYDPQWCCPVCHAALIKYGPPEEATPEETRQKCMDMLAEMRRRSNHEDR